MEGRDLFWYDPASVSRKKSHCLAGFINDFAISSDEASIRAISDCCLQADYFMLENGLRSDHILPQASAGAASFSMVSILATVLRSSLILPVLSTVPPASTVVLNLTSSALISSSLRFRSSSGI